MAEYIDREEYCEKHCRCSNEYCDKESCPIWKAPAADVAQVVHGRWIEDGSGIIICPKCNRGYNLVSQFTHYCPNCGAKMDGGDSDATNGNV